MLLQQLHKHGLKHDPFSEEADSGFFFATPALTQRLDLLHHLIQYGELLLVVAGEPGAGKTTLLNALIAGAGERWRVCQVTIDAPTTADLLLAHILAGFDLPVRHADTGAMLVALETHLEALHRSAQIALITIDNGQALEKDALELLWGLLSRPHGFKARILLLCEPGMLKTITEVTTDLGVGKLTHVLDIPALSEEQVGDYVSMRLARAGLVGDTPFTPRVIRPIYRASGGIPGRINTLARQVLVNQASTSRWQDSLAKIGHLVLAPRATRVRRIGLMVVTLILVGLLFLWASPDDPLPSPEQVAFGLPIPGQETSAPNVQGASPRPHDTPALPALPRTENEREVVPPARITKGPDRAFDERSDRRPLLSENLPHAGTTGEMQDSYQAGEPAYPSDDAQISRPTTPPAPSEELPATGIMRNGRIERNAVEDAAHTAPTLEAAGADPDFPATQRPGPSPEPATTSVSSNKALRGIKDVTWLRRQNPDDYTIQLIGTFSKEAMLGFIKTHRLDKQAAWFKTSHQNRDWFVLVYETYATQAAALEGLKGLPEPLRVGKPFTRTVASILESAREVP